MKKPSISKEFLIQHYVNNNESIRHICSLLGVSHRTVKKYLKLYQIPTRPSSCANRLNNGEYADLTDRTFGRLFVVQYETKKGWLCQCECGNTIHCGVTNLLLGRIKSCGCLARTSGASHHRWKGCGDIPRTIFNGYKNDAETKGLDFQITIQYVWSIFEKQQGLCAISKVPITFDRAGRTASLDRIDSCDGYIKGNVQWVHKDINQMKWDFNQTRFIDWCHIISDANSQ